MVPLPCLTDDPASWAHFSREPVVLDVTKDYVGETATLRNATTYTWTHPLGDIISSLLAAGLTLDWFHEHDAVTWRMFKILTQDAEGLWRGRIDPGCRLRFRYGQPVVRAFCLRVYARIHPPRPSPLVERVEGVFGTAQTPGFLAD